MMDGRVKTLHPKVHGGFLRYAKIRITRRRCSRTISRRSICWSSISIRSRRRSARRRFRRDDREYRHWRSGDDPRRREEPDDVAVIVEPREYESARRNAGAWRRDDLDFRQELAQRAFARTAAYDAAISNWLAGRDRPSRARLSRFWRSLHRDVRYGENPHQSAGFYATRSRVLASRPRASCRASSSPTTTSTIPTRPSNSWRNSIRRGPPRVRSSSTPIPAAWRRRKHLRRPMSARCVRSGVGVRRHRRPQSPARRGGRRGDREILTEVIIAPDADEAASRSSRRRKTFVSSSPAACPIRARRA